MKIIIAGGRNFTDYQTLKECCDNILQDQTDIEIVSAELTTKEPTNSEKIMQKKEDIN